MVIHLGPFSDWGYSSALFQLGYGLAPFRLGIWRPLSSWGYAVAPFQLVIWTGPFPTSADVVDATMKKLRKYINMVTMVVNEIRCLTA